LVLYKDRNNKKEGYYFRYKVASGISKVLGRAFAVKDLSYIKQVILLEEGNYYKEGRLKRQLKQRVY
jgi:hypothetical protein